MDFALSLARQAGAIIRDNVDSTLDVQTKSDQSPVTQVDTRINTLVIESVRHHYPDHGILGEEDDYGDGTEKWQWLCDPLDGTKPFIMGVPQSVFMLALLEDGVVQLSVVYDPYLDKMYHAIRGKGAFCNMQPIHVSSEHIPEGYTLLDDDSITCVEALKNAGGKLQQISGTGYKCMLVARGKAVGMIDHHADYHDTGVASLIIEEAGGMVTGLDGLPLKFNAKVDHVVASNGVDHETLLKVANSIVG